MSRNVRELWMSCNSGSTSVWVWRLRIFPLVKSARMYAQVCFGNYLFKLFKKCMSEHPYQYFVLRFQEFKMYMLNLNCKLTLQSLLLFSVSDQDLWDIRVMNGTSAKAAVLICATVCHNYTCWNWSVLTGWHELGLMSESNISNEEQTRTQNICCPPSPSQPMKPRKVVH